MTVPQDFRPELSSPFYFTRKGTYHSVLDFSKKIKGGKLLDFGCGAKPYRSFFEVDEYIGLDYEAAGHDHTNEQIDVFYDGKNIPFENESFDHVLCSEVVEHVFELETTLQEINRVLKKDGLMFVTCPFVWNEHEIPYDFARYTQFALEHIFTKNGFEFVYFEKKGTFIETIFQLTTLYFSKKEKRFVRSKSSPILNVAIYIYNNIGRLLSALLPNNDSLYLSNTFLLRKKTNIK